MSACGRRAGAALLAVAASAVVGCRHTVRYDYGPYLAHMPRTVVVLPPTNESFDPRAPYVYLSTVSEPLAEMGYYVLPVAVVDDLLKQNGLPTPDEMRTADLGRLHDILGADAVLYLDVGEWTTQYLVLDTVTTVSVSGRLVDTATGTVLWDGWHIEFGQCSTGNNNPLDVLCVFDAVFHVVSSESRERATAARHAQMWFRKENFGLLLGPLHPGFREQQEALRAEIPEPEPAEAVPTDAGGP